MRKASKTIKTVQRAQCQDYHCGEYSSNQVYAFHGFKSNKYYVSDRYIELDDHFRRPDGLPLEGFGLEIETECFGIKDKRIYADVLEKIIFVLFPADLFKMQDDSSLGVHDWNHPENNACGIECITQVMKKSFIRNHYRDFQAMYKYFEAFGVRNALSKHCGMHVNISNAVFGDTPEKQREAIRKLHYFINKNFSLSCKLFKRDENNVDYCNRMSYGNARNMEISGGDHYVCLNYSHYAYGRIELRLVGGQRNYYEFRNTMETVFFLCDRVKKIKWEELDDLTKVFKGCNTYVFKRLTDCDLSDEVLLKIRASVKEADFELHNV